MLNRVSLKFIVILAVIILFFLIPSITSNPYYLRILIDMFMFIILAYGVRLLALTGQLTFAQAAFMGIGAYTSALLLTKIGWNFWVCLPLAGIAAAVVAVAIGWITLRIKGAYFAFATLGFGEVARQVWIGWFGGIRGIRGIPFPNAIGNWQFNNMSSYYYLGFCLLLITFFVMYVLDRSEFGVTLRSIGDCDYLSQSLGINIMKYKIVAFVICCFFAGITGAFYASLQHIITPNDFGFLLSMYFLIYAVVGGMSSIMGTIYGVLFLVLLPTLLDYLPNYDPKVEPMIFGVVLIVVVLFLPGGLTSLPQKISSGIKRFKRGKTNKYAVTCP